MLKVTKSVKFYEGVIRNKFMSFLRRKLFREGSYYTVWLKRLNNNCPHVWVRD